MTNAFPGSRRRLCTATAIGAVSLGLLALTGCEKPTPLATLTVGSDSVTAEAACYEESGTIAKAEAQECLGKKAQKTITVGQGDQIRVGVDPDVADTGWLIFVNGQPALQEPVTKTYQSFEGDAFFQKQASANGQQEPPSKSAQVSIVETRKGTFQGVWHLKVVRGK